MKEKGGLVIAQDPDEAAHDGMPRNAILTGAVDLSAFRSPRFPTRSSNTIGGWPSRARRTARGRRMPRRIGCPRSLIFCAQRPPMTSGSTSRGRCNVGSNGAWRWRRSRPMIWIAISKLCTVTLASWIFSPRTCSSTSPASSAIRRCSTSWRRRSFRTWSVATRLISRCESG